MPRQNICLRKRSRAGPRTKLDTICSIRGLPTGIGWKRAGFATIIIFAWPHKKDKKWRILQKVFNS